MPRYFFNIAVRGRKVIPDPEGDEHAGDNAARKHAVMVAREMLSNHIWYKRGLEHWTFVITNEVGRQVGVVPFSSQSRIRKPSKLIGQEVFNQDSKLGRPLECRPFTLGSPEQR
jgi:hypothetical protein